MLRLVTMIGHVFLPLAAATAQVPSETEQKNNWLRAQESQRAFERELFDRAGFPSIAEQNLEGREVRRLLLRDPYGMLAVPGVELERLSNGRIKLRLQYVGWSSAPKAVDRSAWDKLVSNELAIYSETEFRAVSKLDEPPPMPAVCHGWIARLQADYFRTASWTACGTGASGPHFDYIIDIIRLAMATKPECAFDDKDPFWSFNKCFAASQELDDPELERAFSILRKENALAPGADRLAEARRALRLAPMTIGSQAWLDARTAVAGFKEVQDLRRQRLQDLRQLASSANNASAADRAKVQQTIDAWSDFLTSQQANYIDLLQRLVWVTNTSKTD